MDNIFEKFAKKARFMIKNKKGAFYDKKISSFHTQRFKGGELRRQTLGKHKHI